MKNLMIATVLLMATTNIFAQNMPTTIKISENTRTITHELLIEDDTFIHNIRGYACPLPAFNLSPNIKYELNLSHIHNGFRVKTAALALSNPNMRFCNFQTAQEVFGDEFKVGNTIDVNIDIKTTVKKIIFLDGKEIIRYTEKLTAELNGEKLHSEASLSLPTSK